MPRAHPLLTRDQQPHAPAVVVDKYARDTRIAYTFGQNSGQPDSSPYNDRRPARWGNAAISGKVLHTYFDSERPSTGGGGGGNCLLFSGGTPNVLYSEDFIGNTTGASSIDETMIAAVEFSSTTGTQAIAGYYSNSFALNAYGRGLYLSGGTIRASGVSASNGKVLDSGLSVATNTPYVIAARFSSGGALFVNGARYAEGDLSHVWAYRFGVGCTPGSVGNAADLGSSFFYGKVYGVWVLQRGLSNAELRDLTINPWSIFEPEPMEVYWAAAAPGGSAKPWHHYQMMHRRAA